VDLSARKPLIVLVCGGIILALAVGIRQQFGLYLQPISEEFGWGREIFALAIALQNLVWGATQPFFGMAADRWGPGRVIGISAATYTAGLCLMSVSGTPALLHLSAGLMSGMALSGTGFALILGTVGRYFPPSRRSVALGIVGAAGSFGQAVMAPIGQALISSIGWSAALAGIALISVVSIALASGMAGKPADMSDSGIETGLRFAVTQAGTHRGYLLLNLGFFVCGFQVTFIIGHLPAYITDVGLGAQHAATALLLIGLFNIAGSLGWGWLGDRFSKKYLLSTLYFIRSVVILMLLVLPPSLALIYVFSAIMGTLWLGTIPLTSALVGQVFGARYLTSLFSIVFFSHQVGAFLGVWLGGYLYDYLGSYNPVWWINMGLGLIAVALHIPINDRPVYQLARTEPA